MELHGAKDYFDRDKAIIATNRRIIENAKEGADKLKIEIINIPAIKMNLKPKTTKRIGEFESILKNI